MSKPSIPALTVLLLALALGSATALEPPGAPGCPAGGPPLSEVLFAKVADAATRAEHFPRKAQRRGVGGQTNLLCTVGFDGWLSDCGIVSETPAGYGFGQAGVRLGRFYRMEVTTRSGASTAGCVVPLQIRWG